MCPSIALLISINPFKVVLQNNSSKYLSGEMCHSTTEVKLIESTSSEHSAVLVVHCLFSCVAGSVIILIITLEMNQINCHVLEVESP
jgi:hypothetical protein